MEIYIHKDGEQLGPFDPSALQGMLDGGTFTLAVAGALGVGCVLLLVIGTALGAKVRRHATKP